MATLTIRCPWCQYRDYGSDIDLIMAAYRHHEKECKPQHGAFFMPERENQHE